LQYVLAQPGRIDIFFPRTDAIDSVYAAFIVTAATER
jgi:hypothetical protein